MLRYASIKECAVSNASSIVPRMGVAVVMGASAGIGRTYTDRLAGRGYDLLLIARRAERLAQFATTLRGRHGVTVDILVADLSNDEALERVADAISRIANVTMLVSNVGMATMTVAMQTPIGRAESARLALFLASRIGTPASRYKVRFVNT